MLLIIKLYKYNEIIFETFISSVRDSDFEKSANTIQSIFIIHKSVQNLLRTKIEIWIFPTKSAINSQFFSQLEIF